MGRFKASARPGGVGNAESRKKSGVAAAPAIAAEAALSFLKDTKGTVTWAAGELAQTLRISRRDAERILPFLEAQGYVQRGKGKDEWVTTPAGEAVSGAKAPRYTRESVEQEVALLREKIKRANADGKSAWKITVAVAFGDFLVKERARVQAADVGIGLEKRGIAAEGVRSATEAKAERGFLRELRGRTALLNVRAYEEWMGKRRHLDLK